jgi:hypothetical protein
LAGKRLRRSGSGPWSTGTAPAPADASGHHERLRRRQLLGGKARAAAARQSGDFGCLCNLQACPGLGPGADPDDAPVADRPADGGDPGIPDREIPGIGEDFPDSGPRGLNQRLCLKGVQVCQTIRPRNAPDSPRGAPGGDVFDDPGVPSRRDVWRGNALFQNLRARQIPWPWSRLCR